jgi:SPP1 gp7 family putative phage head morphogenesis protein
VTPTLAARRRRTRAAATRRRPVPVPPAAPPRATILAYTQLAQWVFAALDAAVLAELQGAGVLHADDTASPAPGLPEGLAGRLTRRLLGLLRRLTAPAALTRDLDRIAQRTNALSRQQWRAQVKAAAGIDLTTDPDLAPKLVAFRRQNVGLIRSMAREKVSRVSKILTDAGSGTRVETIARRIQDEADASPARAALIARDQVLKLNAEVTQARHEALGLTEYIWRTSKDERVRKEHKLLDGKRFRYDDPPVVSARELCVDRRGPAQHPGGRQVIAHNGKSVQRRGAPALLDGATCWRTYPPNRRPRYADGSAAIDPTRSIEARAYTARPVVAPMDDSRKIPRARPATGS